MRPTELKFEVRKLEDRVAPSLAMVGLGANAGFGLNAAADINVLNLAHIGLNTGVSVGAGVGTSIGLL